MRLHGRVSPKVSRNTRGWFLFPFSTLVCIPVRGHQFVGDSRPISPYNEFVKVCAYRYKLNNHV